MSDYDDLIEFAAAKLAASITDPSPEHETDMWNVLVQAVRLRCGRDDDLAPREDWIDTMHDAVEALRVGVKKRLLESLPGKLGAPRGEIERVLDVEMARLLPREEIERLLDEHLAGGVTSL
jgi:hypothetical protein